MGAVGGPLLCDFEVFTLKVISENSKKIVIIVCMCSSEGNLELFPLSTC